MNKLFEYANQYVEESDWKNLALLKCCLCAIGVMIGVAIPKKHKETAVGIAAGVFTVTYIPLMGKFLEIIGRGIRSEKI